MGSVRNALAVLGAMAAVATALGLFAFRGFDPGAARLYVGLAQALAETGDPAASMVWKRRVSDGLSFEEVDASIRSLAADLNIRDVGALPLGEQVSAMRGEAWRRLTVYLYCNPLTAAAMVEHSEAFAAWLPCRVSLLEDGDGALWLYTLNMDVLLHGGRPLPVGVREEAEAIRSAIVALLDRAAEGEF